MTTSMRLSLSRVPPAPARRSRGSGGARAGGGAERVRRDPSRYSSIEELRRELEATTGQAPFTITRTINWLSEAANKGGHTLAFQAFKWVLGLDNTFSRWTPPADLEGPALAELESRLDPGTLRHLQAILLIPRPAALRLLLRCPALEAVPAGELMRRLVELKAVLPGSDVARMVELLPNGFFAGDRGWGATLEQVGAAAGVLREGLAGADVDKLVEGDPTILFEDPASLEAGVRRMRELWDVDAATLAASDPDELALAVRALGPTGLPKSY